MNLGFNKIILLILLLFVLISILILNTLILDTNYKNKNLLKNICQQFNHNIRDDINYKFSGHLFNSKHKYNNKYLINSNNNDLKTSFVNISDNIYIYSAFETNNDIIVLIGFAKNWEQISDDYNYYNYNNDFKLDDYIHYCGFDDGVLIKTLATIEYLPESHRYYYSAIKVQCKRPKLFDQNVTINRVKLIEKYKQKYPNNKTIDIFIESQFVFIYKNTNLFKTIDNNSSYSGINYNQESNQRPITGSRTSSSAKELVVCVRPLYGNISAINLIEFIAYYRLNGIKKLVFYNSISPQYMSNETKHLFDLLSSIDSVDIIPFYIQNNEELRPIIHANGQLTAIHDCLYRFSNYIQIYVDFDEFLMPYNYRSIKEYLLSADIIESTALVVPTVLFCNEFNQNLTKSSDSLLISNFNRQKTVWPHKIRSKVIILRPEFISQMGIHNVWKVSPFYSRQKSHPILYSKSNQILIYHYRMCCDIIQPYFADIIHFQTINDYVIKDESMKAFINGVKQFIDYYIKVIN